MPATSPSEPVKSGGIHIGDVGGSVNFSALGDIVGGDKITNITTTVQISVEAITQRPLVTTSPYRGLDRFEDRDKDLFFGRDQLIKSLLAQLGASNVLLVLGASGSGKSSVVRAGLLPALSQLIGARFRYFTFVPDVNPFESFRSALQGAGFSQTQTRELLDAHPETPAKLIHTLQREGDQWLFFVDQFEEIFTVCDEALRKTFIAALVAIAQDTASSTKLVLAMRADFLDRFSPFPLFAKIIEKNIDFVADMHPDELRLAIEQPAARHGVVFEQGLVEEIIKDVQGQAGSLPLLQYTLDLLWQEEARKDGLADRHLNTRAYRELGGVRGALQKRANEIYASFGDGTDAKAARPKQEIVRQIFLRLVDLAGEGSNDAAWRPVRRRAPMAMFATAQEQEILQALINQKLLVSNREGDDATVEVAHEALFTSWGRLKNWIEAGKQVIFARNRLADDARRWQRRKEQRDVGADEELLSGSRLSQALDLRGRGDFVTVVGGLSELESRFLDRSIAQREKRAKLRRRLEIAGAALLLLAIVAALFAGWQWWEAKNANKKVGEVQQLARHTSDIGTKPQRSLLLSVRAASLSKDGRGGSLVAIDGLRQQLRATGGRPLRGHEKSTRVAAFSLDRHWLATGSDDGAIRLWDLRNVDPTSRSFLLNGHNGRVHGLAFSPDGRWLVSGGADGAVRLWRLTEEGATPGPVFGGRYGVIHAVAISPKGDWLAFGTQSGNVCMWKMSAEGPLETPCEAWKEQDPVTNVVFSPKGRWLATTCAGVCPKYGAPVRLWDLSADFPNQEPRRLSHVTNLGSEDALLAIAFNADETRLAVAYGYFAEVWDLTQKDPPRHIVGSDKHTGWIRAVGLSPNNRWLATGSSEADVKLLDLTETRKEPIILKGHTAAVNSVVFSDDGRWLATGGDDAIARLWDLADPTIPSTLLRGQDLPVGKVIFSPGAEPCQLVTVGDEPRARLWNIPDPLADPIVLRGKLKPLIIGMAVSADGMWIATSSHEDPKLVLWSTKDPRQPARELPLPGASHAIAFSPDGRWLAAKSHDKGVISLWNFTDLSKPPLELFEHEWGDVRSLGFSPDSRWLVSGTWKGIVNMWEVSSDNPSLEPRFRCQQDPVRGLPAFSSDGRYVATAAHGFTACLWDLTSPNPCDSPRVLGPHGDVVYVVTFSPDCRWAATASMDGKGRLWDLRAGSEPKLMSELAFKDRVVQATFSPDDRWVAFGSWDGTLKLLDLKNSAASKPTELAGHAGRILSASFSPDSRWLASGSEDRTTRLWDPTDPSAAPVVLRGHEGSVAHVGFSKDSRWVITGAYDGTVRLWRLKLTDLVDIACQTAGRDLTPEEAKAFAGTKLSGLGAFP